ncbi:MAG: UvrD-helicase domain-containing protein [Mariprofundaceae bacterium]|nr:UvrD-helicase domain-containing protein [Mariprofundaceae bacterium]
MTSEVRQRAIHPAYSYLVRAPAGSGKTELLIQRILSLLAIVDEPEEILAMTFTRKAAAEMRNRVLTSLSMVRPDDSSSHKMHTWELAQTALARSHAKGWNLAEYPSRLRIMTLDSLTGALARQLPLLSGLGDMPAPSEHIRAVCRQAAEDALNEALKDDFIAVQLLLLHEDHNTAGLIDLMSEMLENREKWLGYMGEHGRNLDGLRQVLEANMAAFMQQQIQDCDIMIPLEVKEDLPELMRFSTLNNGNRELMAFAAWPGSGADELEQWRLLADFVLTGSAQLKKTVNKNHGFPPEAKTEKKRMQDMLALLAETPELGKSLHILRTLPQIPEFNEAQWKIVESMFHLLPRAVLHLQTEFAVQGKADFTEIALRALDAVSDQVGNPSDLLLKLDYRIRHILVDEFQDTSELQIRLLRCLTSGWEESDGRTLFLVGDPMQSIYRFRKAEVGLFLRAANNQVNLPCVASLQLERNFRSAPAIVGWVNTAFEHIFPAAQDSVNGAIPYAAAIPALAHAGCVQLHVQQGMDHDMEAATVAKLVRKALNSKQRTGVLARTRKDLHAIMAALREADIVFRAVNILPLNIRPEVRALRAVMRALLHPKDIESWAAVLRMPCCGLTTADLFTLMAHGNRPVWDSMQDDCVIDSLCGDARARIMFIRQAFEPCMAMSGRVTVRDLTQTAWLRLKMPEILDETACTNVETVLDLMEELEIGGNMRGRIDFAYFDERLKALYSAPDASIEAARVELLTMHGAKGLQWDVVILPGLGKTPKSSDTPLLAFTEVPSDKGEMLLMSPKAATRGKDPLYDLIRNIEKNKEHHESMRLLYVACTRAQTELHMLGHVSEKDEKPAKHSFMEFMYQYGKDCFGARIQSMQPGEYGVAGGRIPLTRIKTAPELPFVTVRANGYDEPEYGWAGPEAAPVGNTVHAALQRVAETGVENWNEALTDEMVAGMQRMLLAEGLSGQLLEEALNRCRKALRNASNSERGKWILAGAHPDAHCEWALSVMDGNVVSQHVLDRSFVDEDGTRWIIDYKTGSHEGGDIGHFLDEEQKRHAPQLQRYARVLHRMEPERPIRTALYFPLLDAWREWGNDRE